MIIANCGYGSSGASSVFDFLRGYESIKYTPDGMEFDILHQPDGLLDLKYHLCISKERIACNSAIQRFATSMKKGTFSREMRTYIGKRFDQITDAYIESIIQLSWLGRSVYDPVDISSTSSNAFIHKINSKIEHYLSILKRKPVHFPKDRLRFFSMMDANRFDLLTKKYLYDLFHELNLDKGNDIVIDMLFNVTNPKMGAEFFDNVKTIVVTRDPRCMYLDIKAWDGYCTFLPCYDIHQFIDYYKLLMENQKYCEDVLYISFDEFIYDYFTVASKIMDYLGYPDRPQNEFKYFNPNISVANTFPRRKGIYQKEISLIEEELSQYLYNFPEYTEINLTRIP